MPSSVSAIITFLILLLQPAAALGLPNPPILGHRQCPTFNLTLPASSLPSPSFNLTLKHIAFAFGVQNYTCTSLSPVPVAIGALATLYDIAALSQQPVWPAVASSLGCTYALLPPSASLDAPFALAYVPVLGHHFFSAQGSPSFDLFATGDRLQTRRVAGTPAPGGACANAEGRGAVDWLALEDNGLGWSKGLKMVYRVATAGGKPVGNCVGVVGDAGVVRSVYVAQYWFYG